MRLKEAKLFGYELLLGDEMVWKTALNEFTVTALQRKLSDRFRFHWLSHLLREIAAVEKKSCSKMRKAFPWNPWECFSTLH